MAYVKIDSERLDHAKSTLTDLADKISALACLFGTPGKYDGSEIKFDAVSSKGMSLILNEVVESIYDITSNELNGEVIDENPTK